MQKHVNIGLTAEWYSACMDVLVGYISALQYWRTVGPRFLRDRQGRRAATRRARAAIAEGERPYLPGNAGRPGGCELPVHVLVGDDDVRTTTSEVVSRTWGSLPAASELFADAGEGFLVSLPEFCFLQVASKTSLANLIQLGFELCGIYALSKYGPASRRSAPLTSVARLKTFVEKAEGAPGRKKALRALRYVLDGSASPKETELVMLLCLPYKLGGYGIDAPRLNYHVDVPPSLRKMASKSYCECDVCWPEAKLTIEYDSLLHHSGEDAVTRDSKRSNTLIALGYTVISATNVQVSSGEDLNKLANLVAKRTGKRLRFQDPGFTHKQFELRALLCKPLV